jgi:hypothetical protein
MIEHFTERRGRINFFSKIGLCLTATAADIRIITE